MHKLVQSRFDHTVHNILFKFLNFLNFYVCICIESHIPFQLHFSTKFLVLLRCWNLSPRVTQFFSLDLDRQIKGVMCALSQTRLVWIRIGRSESKLKSCVTLEDPDPLFVGLEEVKKLSPC